VAAYTKRLLDRFRFLRFFLFAPLYLVLPFGIRAQPRLACVLLLFALGSNFYPYFYPHYVAACSSVLILLAVLGLERLPRAGPIIFGLCGLQFLYTYTMYSMGRGPLATWNYVNGPNPQGRASITNELARQTGKQLVFVHYVPEHRFSEWVHNAADVDGSPVIYANDLDPVSNEQIRNHYPDRHVWLLEPDVDPPKLRPYPKQTSPFLNVP
jgi:hypothetical protein